MSNENDNSLNNKPRRESMRKLLVGGGVIGASQVLPDKWTGAVVNSVIVPAHAQTSAATMTFVGTGPAP